MTFTTRGWFWWLSIAISLGATGEARADERVVLVEVESLAERGGWVVDQQFMDQMGSPYLLAHGLGVPVGDATGTARFATPGTYRVWVRTRDWVAPWKAPGAPGRFQVLLDGKPLATTFGTEGDPWHWQDGGVVEVGPTATLALHDLTGFEGRCDAVLFCRDLEFHPPDGGPELAALRGRLLGWDLEPEDGGAFDLVVVGGGVAGTACAISAARQGLKVALIQDRPVLGGNGSSEVRVWPEGKINLRPFRHIGDIVGEIVPPHPPGQAMALNAPAYEDKRKEDLVRAETNITLMLNRRVVAAHAPDRHIQSVIAQDIQSGRRTRVRGRFFADTTGDGVLGAMAGADSELLEKGHQGATNPWSVAAVLKNEPTLECECKDKDPLSLAFTPATSEQPFPRCPWAIDMSNLAFPGRKNFVGQWPGGSGPLANLGRWFWETGHDKHPIDDMEWVRDHNLRAMYGAWDTLKNVDKLYPNERLKWASFIAGKRESRRLLGDVIVTADDFRKNVQWPDPAFPCTWHIDIHLPDPDFLNAAVEPFIAKATSGKDYSYKGPYWAPYRSLYSRNIDNLFMAGRDISVSHDGLGAVRVMRTCGMMGETVGKAAWVAVRYQTTPRGVYESHLYVLKELMQQPGAMRRASLEAPLALPPGVVARTSLPGLDPAKLPGLIVDETAAELVGDWRDDGSLTGFVGEAYVYSSDAGATARFPIHVEKSGAYEVRVAWRPAANRSKRAPITVGSADGPARVALDQTQAPKGADGFETIGRFRFETETDGAVTFEVKGAGGVVHVDAVQLIAVEAEAAPADGPLAFERVVIDDNFPGAYQVEVADIDGDAKLDLVVVGGSTCAWYQNPSWKKRIISGKETTPDIITSAARDLDGDGRAEVAIGFDFAMNEPTRGKLGLAAPGTSIDDPWGFHQVADVPSIHRLRWARADGPGKDAALIVAPIFGRSAAPPSYDQAPASLFRVTELTPTSRSALLNVVGERFVQHAIRVIDVDGDGIDDVLTADNQGVGFVSLKRGPDPTPSVRTLVPGADGPAPARGCSEIHVGHLGASGPRFLATIEPWHGSQVVVWVEKKNGSLEFGPRLVVDDTLDQGHALWVADVDGDGFDEVFAGHRGKDRRVAVYDFDPKAKRWARTVIDREIAAQDLRGGDLDGDGAPDVVAVGGATRNVVWYRPVKPRRAQPGN
jgi:hypothetical protein